MARFNEDGTLWHLNVKPEDVGEYVFLPGDPFRTDLIASYLDDAKCVAHFREHKTWTGYLDGVKVSVTSTGMGTPSASIAIEELIACGAHTFLRIGTAGRVSERSKEEHWDGAILTSAVRQDGTTKQYVPVEYPAVAHHEMVTALIGASKSLDKDFIVGIGHSKDSFYGQIEPETMPIEIELKNYWQAWERANVVCSEMESAVLFVIGSIRDVRVGSIMNFKDMDATIKIAKETFRNLIAQDLKIEKK